jgi:hypothetical protein
VTAAGPGEDNGDGDGDSDGDGEDDGDNGDSDIVTMVWKQDRQANAAQQLLTREW